MSSLSYVSYLNTTQWRSQYMSVGGQGGSPPQGGQDILRNKTIYISVISLFIQFRGII